MNQEKLRPKVLGDFEILRELGRGGMGVVYEARQRSLNRCVALKVLSSGLGLSERAITRFRREAEAAAKLHHTNIVPIYATGAEHGTHYYAMELIDGPSLDQVIRQMRAVRVAAPAADVQTGSAGEAPESAQLPDWVGETLAFEGRPRPNAGTRRHAHESGSKSNPSLSSSTKYFDNVAKMLADVADALQHAHEEGVIHRDIKPSNLLLSADGRLSLNDFGLARVLEQPGMTMSGEFVGSPLYMSPEQISAGRAPLDHRTDIYSLGATLYELLTLEPPFPGQQRDHVIAQILHKEPVSVRRKNRKVPVDLETICMKALEKDPDRRYQTAGELANDLRHFVNRFAISARRVGPVGRTVKWVRRHPTVAGLCGLLLVAASIASGFAYRAKVISRQAKAQRLSDLKSMAMTAAMSGDFQQAEIHIRAAEILDPSPGWTRLLNGLVAIYRGDYHQAVSEMQQAEELMPESPAAHALLSLAYYRDTEEDTYFSRLDKLSKSKAVLFEDHLFKGMALSETGSPLALASLHRAYELNRSSPVVALFLGHAKCLRAMDTGDLHLAREALSDTQIAGRSLDKNPMLSSDKLFTRLVLSNLYREVGQIERASEEIQSAELAPMLGMLSKLHPDERAYLWFFLMETGNEEQALKVIHSIPADARGRDDAYLCIFGAIDLWRRGETEAAQALFDRSGGARDYCRFVQALLDLESQETSPQEVLTQYKSDLDKGLAKSGAYLVFDWCILRLLGDEVAAKRVAAGYADFAAKISLVEEGRGFADVAEFMKGGISVPELEKATMGHRRYQSAALFAIGVDELANGRRDSAIGRFQECQGTHYFWFYMYFLSRAFEERLTREPSWPSWIPHSGG